MKKRSNAFLYIVLFLFTVSLAGGVTGLMASKMSQDKNEQNTIETNDYSVTYKYYVDEEEASDPVKQEEIEITSEAFEGAIEKKELYSFDKYTCTNNVEGSWNNEEWTFTPVLTSNTTCRLYFVKNFHNVIVTTVSGVLADDVKQITVNVEKGKNSLVDVSPIEGYKFSDVSCTNNAVATYDADTKKLTITSAPKDAMCTVTFGINEYKAQIKVSNGTIEGEDIKTGNYGDKITFKTIPATNYGNPTVNCTNEQEAKFIEDEVVIEGITNDTVCTVQYGLVRYSVNLKINNGTLLSSSTNPQYAISGGTVRFGISPNQGYGPTNPDLKCDKEAKIEAEFGTISIYNVTSDLNCEVTLKANSEE